MTKFTDRLWSDIAAEHGATLEQAKRPGPARTRRPGLIASGTLALAVVGTALALGLTSTGGAPAGTTSTAAGGTTITTAAYTITKHSDGSILVHVKFQAAIDAAEAKLKSMGYGLQIFPKPGKAPVPGPLACPPIDGAPQNPKVQVLLGDNGTQVIKPTAQNEGTGVGTWHIGTCNLFPLGSKGNSGTGNTGTASATPGSQTAAYPAGVLVEGTDGSVIMWVNQRSGLATAASKLAKVGIHGRPDVVMAPGAAPVKGPIDCKPAAGVPAPKPKLKLLLGENGTVSFGPSANGGTWHAASCTLLPAAK